MNQSVSTACTADSPRSQPNAPADDAAAADGRSWIAVRCWRDPVVERVGFDAAGEYVELFWLPVIGPTSTLLLRRLAIFAVLQPDQCWIDARSTASALGLGPLTAANSTFARSVQRLTIFGLARAVGSVLEVRTSVPPLTLKQLARLPENLQLAHSLWSETDPSDAHAFAYALRSTQDVGREIDGVVEEDRRGAALSVSAS